MTSQTKNEPLIWSITPWSMNGRSGWNRQPVVLVEGRAPFFADTPQEYIVELERLHEDKSLARGIFYTMIGQLKDALELAWNPAEEQVNGKESPDPN